jgi:pimeloyl-ACP methyl ester carboxylesterase
MATDSGMKASALICLHGAGSYPSLFDDWPTSFPQWAVLAPDLQADLDLPTASMEDYVRAAVRAARESRCATVALCGWSMGGLVALLAAGMMQPAAVIALEPSPPAEIAGVHANIAIEPGTFDPDEVNGAWPDNPPTRRESGWALAERQRGISVPTVSCPLLVVASRTYATTRGRPIADFYGGDLLEFPDLHHVSLVDEAAVRTAILSWLNRVVTAVP